MLILVLGLPGSGKSYFAQALRDKLGAQYLGSDILREELGLRGSYDLESKKRVYDEIHDRMQLYLRRGDDVILDASFYRADLRNRFLDTARQSQIPAYIIRIKAREETIKARLEQKREHSEADFVVYQKVKAGYEPINQHHLVLWSDQIELKEMLEKACSYLQLKQMP